MRRAIEERALDALAPRVRAEQASGGHASIRSDRPAPG
jgi:hypothetical protein